MFGEFPDVPTVSDKLAVFGAHREEWDTVFIGSSRVFNQLSPKLFDADRRAAGQASRSFNLAASAMRPPEDFQTLGRALALRPTRLRLVIMELMNVYPTMTPTERDTRRVTGWHRPRETAWITGAVLVAPQPPFEMGRRLENHLLAGARSFFHVGDAQARMSADPPRAVGGEGLGEDSDGYAPTSKARKAEEPEYRRFLVDLPGWERTVSGLAAGSLPERDPVNPLLRWELPRQIARLREQGIATVLFIPPVPRPERGLRRLGERSGAAAVFAFNDPAAFPELFRAEVRTDAEHLDAEGAEQLTHALAGRVIAWGRNASLPAAGAR